MSTSQISIPDELNAVSLQGRLVRLERFDALKHANELWNNCNAVNDSYTIRDNFHMRCTDRHSFDDCLQAESMKRDNSVYAVISRADEKAKGLFAYGSANAHYGTLEV